MMSLATPLLPLVLVSSTLALPLTSNEVTLREIAISESKPELLRTAVKYARYGFFQTSLMRMMLTQSPIFVGQTFSEWR